MHDCGQRFDSGLLTLFHSVEYIRLRGWDAALDAPTNQRILYDSSVSKLRLSHAQSFGFERAERSRIFGSVVMAERFQQGALRQEGSE